jgi:hypothetical protein
VARVGIGHEYLTGLHMGAVATEDTDLAITQLDGFRLGFLKDAQVPLLQSAAKPAHKLARAKAAAKAIDDTPNVDVFGRAAACFQLPSRKQSEERAPLLSDQWHQRPKAALLHKS